MIEKEGDDARRESVDDAMSEEASNGWFHWNAVVGSAENSPKAGLSGRGTIEDWNQFNDDATREFFCSDCNQHDSVSNQGDKDANVEDVCLGCNEKDDELKDHVKEEKEQNDRGWNFHPLRQYLTDGGDALREIKYESITDKKSIKWFNWNADVESPENGSNAELARRDATEDCAKEKDDDAPRENVEGKRKQKNRGLEFSPLVHHLDVGRL
jgi:hypothetical protein